jgi:hypothetical protein
LTPVFIAAVALIVIKKITLVQKGGEVLLIVNFILEMISMKRSGSILEG